MYRNLPPGALVSLQKMMQDERSEPQYGERVPYLVVYKGLDSKLMDSVVSPDVFLSDKYV